MLHSIVNLINKNSVTIHKDVFHRDLDFTHCYSSLSELFLGKSEVQSGKSVIFGPFSDSDTGRAGSSLPSGKTALLIVREFTNSLFIY